MIDIRKAEMLYQEFIEFRDMFLTKALKESEAHSTNMYGQKFRPVVKVSSRKVAVWQELIQKWGEYAHHLRQFPELGIEKSLYEPEPLFITGAIRVRVNVLPAITSTKVSREKVLKKIEDTIAQFKGGEDTKQFIWNLESQRDFVAQLPPKTQLRIRRGGYEDLICTYSTVDTPKIMERVTANGVFFDDRTLRYGMKIGKKSENGRVSIYDNIQPLPITIYRDAKVYLIEDVERATKAVRAPEAVQERTREAWNRANEKRRTKEAKKGATLKGASNSAGEANPAGGEVE